MTSNAETPVMTHVAHPTAIARLLRRWWFAEPAFKAAVLATALLLAAQSVNALIAVGARVHDAVCPH